MSRPEYDVLLPRGEGPETQFEIGEALRAGLNGRLSRATSTDKKRAVHGSASTCDSLVAVHPQAIQIGAPWGTGEMVGTGNTFIPFGLGFMAMGVWALFKGWSFFDPLFFIGCILTIALGFFIFSYALRISYLSPRDVPVVFNRQTRDVSICVMEPVRFWRFRFWHRTGIGKVVTTPWEHVEARSYKILQMTGEAARDTYVLRILWGEASDPRKLQGFAPIGYLGWYEDELLWRLWEHIRRYMEEDGPAIQPGEHLRTSGAGRMPELPAAVIAAAGGPPLSTEEVARLAEGGGQREN